MSIETTKKLLSAFIASVAGQENQGLSRITHCIDCHRKISTARRWQNNCQRCRRCSIRFEKRKLKLDLILEAVTQANEKIDLQNDRIDQMQTEIHLVKKMVDEMARKNRRNAFVAGIVGGGVGGGLITLGFELMRMKLGG